MKKNQNLTHIDKFHDECGVFGIHSKEKKEIARLVYYSLYALQHRGQESAGIAVNEGHQINSHKGMGLVADVFDDQDLDSLTGTVAIGHVRYSTTGDSFLANAQPLVVKHKGKGIALAHNGNLVNADGIRELLEDDGVVFQTTLDTEVIANLFARNLPKGIEHSIRTVNEMVKGAFALVIALDDKLIGVRDPYGLRPLCIGKLDESYVISSESCALDTIGADLIRDVEPGEIVIIDENGLKSIKSNKWCKKHACIFELIYFARPDSIVDGINANSYRYKTGRILAKQKPVEADRVIAVPDSGIPAAIGYAEESGIPYGVGLIKNRYIGRTFIQPTQEMREMGVKIKLNVLKKNVEGKRVVIIDDSIVRGTTSRRIVALLRKNGAKEIHFRVSSPPVKFSCHFGIDTPNREQLVGAQKSVEEIREMIGADSLDFLSQQGMMEATNQRSGFCSACFDGDYPMEVPLEGEKFKFESKKIK